MLKGLFGSAMLRQVDDLGGCSALEGRGLYRAISHRSSISSPSPLSYLAAMTILFTYYSLPKISNVVSRSTPVPNR